MRNTLNGGLWCLVAVGACSSASCAQAVATDPAAAVQERLSGEGPGEHVSASVSARSVDLEQVAWRLASGNARLVVLGDSFAVPYWARVFPAFIGEWSYGGLSAVEGGASQQSQLSQGYALASPVLDVQATPGDYRVFKSMPPFEYCTLPVRGIREFGGPLPTTTGDNGSLIRIALWNDRLDPSGTERVLHLGDEGRVRYLYYMPFDTGRAVGEVRLRTSEASLTLDLFDGARKKRVLGEEPDGSGGAVTPGQINAAYADLPVSLAFEDARPNLYVDQTSPISGSGLFTHPAGAVWYRGPKWAGGLYYSYLADPSWSYAGYWRDERGVGSLDKRVSAEQMAYWLDATTLDPDQPVVFVFYLAAERGNLTSFDDQFGALTETMGRAANMAGLRNVFYLFVLPHMHTIETQTLDEARAWIEEQERAMFKIARERADVAAASIYAATDGVLFDGSDGARDWLRRHGYGSFTYALGTVDLADGEGIEGRLLDDTDLHPTNEGAPFFAQRLARLFDKPVRLPDLNGDGVVDAQDLAEQQAHPRDLNGDGRIDQADTDALATYVQQNG